MNDPEPHECVGCLRRLSPPNLWLCDLCVSTAVELGYEATPHYHPGDDIVIALWNKSKERQRAEAEKRGHGPGKPQQQVTP